MPGITEHILLKHRKPRYTCEDCGKPFSYHYKLTQHQKVHTDEFECNDCEKRFMSATHLQIHQRIHTGCSQFEIHMRVHTGRHFNVMAVMSVIFAAKSKHTQWELDLHL